MANNQPNHAMPLITMSSGDTVLLTGSRWGVRRFSTRTLGRPSEDGFTLVAHPGGGSFVDSRSDRYGAVIVGVDGRIVRRIAACGVRKSYLLEFTDDTFMFISEGGTRDAGTRYTIDTGRFGLVQNFPRERWTVIYEAGVAPVAQRPDFTDEEIDKALAEIKQEHGLCGEFDDAVEKAKKVPSYLKRLKRVAKKYGEEELYEELLEKLQPKVWKVGDVVPAQTVINKFWTGRRTVQGPHMLASFSQTPNSTVSTKSAHERTIVWIEE